MVSMTFHFFFFQIFISFLKTMQSEEFFLETEISNSDPRLSNLTNGLVLVPSQECDVPNRDEIESRSDESVASVEGDRTL